MFGMIKLRHGEQIGIISVDTKGQHHLASKCETDWTGVNRIDQVARDAYSQIRKYYLAPQSFTWSETLSSDESEDTTVLSNLDAEYRLYSSKYFPSKLARVVISRNIAAFVHHDGTVRMKTTDCLGRNEKILIEGLKLVEPERDRTLFSPSGNKVLKKYLKQNPIDEASFYHEQDCASI